MATFKEGMTINEKILEWSGNAHALKRIKAIEMLQRNALFAELFPDPKVGTQHHSLGAGYKITAVYKNEDKLDEASLQLVIPEIEKLGESAKAELDEALKYKPSLVAKGYKDMSDEVRTLFEECVVTTPRLNSLVLVAPKPVADNE
jgi:hypothetical protein